MVIMSIILAVVIAALIITAKRLVYGSEELKSEEYVIPAIIGVGTGIVNYFSANLLGGSVFLALVFIAVMIGLIVWLTKWWIADGGRWIEMVPFIVLIVLFCLTMKAPAYALASIISIPLVASLVNVVPLLSGAIAIFIMVYDYLRFLCLEIDGSEKERKLHKGLGWLAVAVLALLLTTTLATKVDWTSAYASGDDSTTSDEVIIDDSDSDVAWHYYNAELQSDSDEVNNFNFGPNPGNLTAAEFDADFRERLRNDPALGAAAMAWADANLGTRYLGEFYESCKGDWAKTINASKETFRKNPELYTETLNAFFKMLDSAEVKVTDGNNLDDQMYMNPYTVDGIPDVIVMETPDHTGTFLTYVFTIKGTGKVEVSYRTECGYQPTNVEEIMNITPQKTPSKPSNPSKPDKPTKPGGKGDKPDKPSKPKYDKDPSKAPKKNTEPNDDPGPGSNTNNPSNPNKSTKDTNDSSSSMTYDEYKDNVNKLKDTNKNQKTGSDSNKPSTPTPSKDTNVDNNGDKGTGNGGANKPTPTQEKPKEIANDSAGEAWGGPSD